MRSGGTTASDVPPSVSPSASIPDDKMAYWWFTRIPRYISTPILLTYFWLSIAQSLPITAVAWMMIYDLEMSPALTNVVYTAWFQMGIARPVWGLISDHFPIYGYRRRPYLIGACFLTILFTILMGMETTAAGTGGFIACGLGVNLFWQVAESMTDSVVVERGNEQTLEALRKTGFNNVIQQHRQRTQRGHTEMKEKEEPLLQSASDSSSLSSSSSQSSSSAISDSSMDELAQGIKARLQSECMAVRTIGTIIAYAVSIGLLKVWSYRAVVLANAVTFTPAIIAACFIEERKVKTSYYGMAAVHTDGTIAIDEEETLADSIAPMNINDPTIAATSVIPSTTPIPVNPPLFLKAKLRQLWKALKLALYPVLFIFAYYAMPTSGDTYYYYLYGGDFNFEAWEADLFSFIGLLGSLIGTLFYARYLTTFSVAKLFIISTILATLVDALKFFLVFNQTEILLSMSPALFIVLSSLLSSFIGGISNMLPIVLAHQYAPRLLGMEGSMFSIFQSADRAGVIVSGSLSALLTDRLGIVSGNYDKLWILMLICSALEYAPLLLIPILLKKKPLIDPFHAEYDVTEMHQFRSRINQTDSQEHKDDQKDPTTDAV